MDSHSIDFSYFSDTANDYLSEWSEQFDRIKDYNWAALRAMPPWGEIEKTMDGIPGFDVDGRGAKVFPQFGYIKNFCTAEKFGEWKAKNLPSEERWVEVFKHMESAEVPYLEFSRIVEFIMCLPGSSAPVERVFSSAKNTWKIECSKLEVKTLKSMLLVKNNLDYKCVDFYHFLKTQPQLLRKISAVEKYTFKKPSQLPTNADGPETAGTSRDMSIESAQDEETEVDNQH